MDAHAGLLFLLFVVISLVSFGPSGGEGAEETRAAGDLLHRCFNTTLPIGGGRKTQAVCVTLSPAQSPPCTVDFSLSIGGAPYLTKNLGKELAPEVCEPFPQLPTCSACVTIFDSANNPLESCVALQAKCAGIPTGSPKQLGCFLKSELASIVECQRNQCLNGCSGKGTCVDRRCQCDFGYYGDDCSDTKPKISGCSPPISQLGQPVCLDIGASGGCTINVKARLGSGLELYNKNYTIEKFKSTFLKAATNGEGFTGNGKPLCTKFSGCDVCIKFNNLEITVAKVSVCPAATATCAGFPFSTSLDCLEDKSGELGRCLLTCGANCDAHGTCTNGVCKCDPGYMGYDCMTPDTTGTGGDPTGGGSGGNTGSGGTVSEASSATASGGKKGGGAVIVVIIVLAVIVLAGLGAFWWYRRRNNNNSGGAKFSRLNALSVNSDDFSDTEEASPVTLDASSDDDM
jgi:Tenascin EGF domain